jgi:hypothetical protein
MSDLPQKRRWSPFSMMWAVIILLVMYELSIGPYYWFLVTFDITYPPYLYACQIYAPLVWLEERSELYMAFGDWYLHLWVP